MKTQLKTLVMLFLQGIMLQQLAAQEQITFKGQVTDDYPDAVVYMYNNLLDLADSAAVVDGTFEISVPYQGNSVYLFYSSYDIKVKKGYSPFGILVDSPGEINMVVALKEGFPSTKTSNAKAQTLYEQFLTQVKNSEHKDEDLKKFILQHPDSYASVSLLNQMGKLIEPQQRLELLHTLAGKLQETYEGKRILDRINGELLANIGAVATAFTLNDQNDQAVALADYKGKYVLLDFWASWCMPCRAEFPHIKAAYEKYKDSGFEVIGISTDKKEENWRKALTDLQLPWTQVLDFQGDQGIALPKYAVSALPTSYLIDPQGKIVAKNLRGAALEEELAKLLPKQASAH